MLGSTAAIDMGTGLPGRDGGHGRTRPGGPAGGYSNVTLDRRPAASHPGICPATFTCTDVGTDILPGNQVYLGPQQGGGTAGTCTIQGGGSDIWSSFDNFRYLYQNFPQDPANSANGDGTDERPGGVPGQPRRTMDEVRGDDPVQRG